MKSIELIVSTLSRMEFPSWTTDTNGALSRSLHQSIEVQSCDNLETEDQGQFFVEKSANAKLVAEQKQKKKAEKADHKKAELKQKKCQKKRRRLLGKRDGGNYRMQLFSKRWERGKQYQRGRGREYRRRRWQQGRSRLCNSKSRRIR